MTITAQQKSIKDWSVSPSAISIAEEILLAKALLETITPLVNEVNKKVISENNFLFEIKTRGEGPYQTRPFTYEDYLQDKGYRMLNLDWDKYHELVKEDLSKVKFTHISEEEIKDGFCPKLVAETAIREGYSNLINDAEPFSGVSRDAALRNFDRYNKYKEILLNLVISGNPNHNFNVLSKG